MARRELERPLAGDRVVDLVAACSQVCREGALELRLVVDDQHTRRRSRHVSTGMVTTIVVPPPGVSSM